MPGIPTGNNVPSGSNVLSGGNVPASGGNIPSSGGGAAPLLPPGTPVLWYDAQDINLLANVGIVDGASITTWKNKGSLGAAANLVQATGATKPTFQKVASLGKLNNLSSVRFSGTQYTSSGAYTLQAQPCTWCFLFLSTTAGLQVIQSGSGTNKQQMYLNATAVTIYNGAITPPGLPAVSANQYHVLGQVANGASSLATLDGTDGSVVNQGALGHDLAVIGCDSSLGSAPLFGDMVEELAYTGGAAPSMASIAAYFATKYGATPQ